MTFPPHVSVDNNKSISEVLSLETSFSCSRYLPSRPKTRRRSLRAWAGSLFIVQHSVFDTDMNSTHSLGRPQSRLHRSVSYTNARHATWLNTWPGLRSTVPRPSGNKPPKSLGPTVETAETFQTFQTVGTAIQGLAWAGVAYYLYSYVVSIGQEGNGEGQRVCETCGGSGYVECWCSRWSDGDARGCGSCGGSMSAVCHSCRGGGTAVPIEARVLIRNETEYK